MDDSSPEPRVDVGTDLSAARNAADAGTYALHHPTEDDWRELRDIRLRSIRDTPIAFLEDIDAAERHPESEWHFRGRRNAEANSHQVVAIAPDGRWVATFAAFISQGQPDYAGGSDSAPERNGPQANLVGVWIDPAHRGAGLAERMLDEVARWVRRGNFDALYLMVHAENARAASFYRRAGFIETGVRTADHRGADELEMALTLTS